MIKILSIDQDPYPQYLKQLPSPPDRLFIRGSIQALSQFSIAIVGSRKPTSYGKKVTECIGSEISERGIIIVSGCAYGIDAIAHEQALQTRTSTIAVLGGGVDDESVYPSQHLGLVRRIIKGGGAVISEFAPGTKPRPGHFPQRNRIIAGLARGTVVIEAGDRSGALSTARHALDQSREVFAVPGSIFSPLSKGTNALLDRGAHLARSGQEIIEEVSCGYAFVQPRAKQEEFLVIKRALRDGPKSLESLMREGQFSRGETLRLLTQLEMDGQISRLSGQIYTLYEQTRYR